MVTCPQCGASRGDGDRFCEDCGAPLGRCPSCGEPITPGKPFCRFCGHQLADLAPASSAAAAAAARGLDRASVAERRVCSVLFCDLVGFTRLSESRDPEAVRELLSQYSGLGSRPARPARRPGPKRPAPGPSLNVVAVAP
jgi:hypothetical protein